MKTQKQFKSELHNINPKIIVLGEYKNAKTHILVKCKTCGHKWKAIPSNLLRGRKCPKCMNRLGKYYTLKTNDQFINELSKINNSIEPLQKYINSSTKILFKCKTCKNKWYARPADVLKGKGCPECSKKIVAQKRTKNNEIFLKELKIINSDIVALDEYDKSRTKIRFKCLKCNNIWLASPSNILRGRKCPKCALEHRSNLRRKKENDFLKQVYKINPNIEILSPYEGDKYRVEIKCKRCSHVWKTTPSSLLRGSGCPRCSHTGTSYVEQIILLTLRDLLSCDVVSRDREAIGMELDIYIPSKKIAIEYGAWPWHIGKEKRDKKKIDLCKKNKIKIIQIFDAYKGNRKSDSNTWLYQENISKESNDKLVKSLLQRICKSLKIEYTIKDSRYEQIKKEARLNSRRMSTEKFKEKMKSINNDILILGEFYDQLTKIEVKCKKCGHQWKIIPASLLRGNGCPICRKKEMGIKMRKTNERFVKELSAKFPLIKPLNKYQTENTKMKFRCLKCGHIWVGLPKSILKSKRGCPVCAKKRIAF